MSQSKTPQIRFPEFDEEWQKKRLDEIFTERKESCIISEEYPQLAFTIAEGVINPEDKKTNKRDFLIKDIETKKFAVTEVDDIIYNPANLKFGAIHRNKLKRGGVSPIYAIFSTEQFPAFMEYLVKRPSFIQESLKYLEGTVIKLMTLKPRDFLLMKTFIPSIPEQKKIAGVFTTLDTYIEIETKKTESYKSLKAAMLQKMFPKKGYNVPEIRFPGFTDDWEQRKLGELVEFYNGDRSSRYPNDSDMVPEGIPFINAGDLVMGRVKLDTANKITEEKYNELSGAKIQRGDIIYCLRGTLGKNAFVDNFDIGTVASSLVDIRPKKIVGKYLFQVLNSDIEYRQRTVNDEGAAQPNLSAKNLSQFDIPMPNEIEQEKIAAYFENLDHLITLHQRKLEQLKTLKHSLQQKMFI